MRLLALAAALALSSLTPTHAEEIPGRQHASGFWCGSGHNDEGGTFHYCSVSVGYTNGETLWLGLFANETLAVLLSHPDVRFRQGRTFDGWLMLETGLPTRGVLEAWDEGFAGITLQGIDASIGFLTRGQWLRLLGIGIDEACNVTGIVDALGLARDCRARHAGGRAIGNAKHGVVPPMPKAPDLLPRTGGVDTAGIGTRPGGALGTPAPRPSP